MPQLIPFFFFNQLLFSFIILFSIIYIFLNIFYLYLHFNKLLEYILLN
uniref:ATP synthase protein 8 n=1 Tax=Hypsizygus marmoreus TaxID=39966 RepID=A0A4P8D2T4_HYPMA|nr:ATP synthase F0 subunit 8 [Hypsizygus marmoreus]